MLFDRVSTQSHVDLHIALTGYFFMRKWKVEMLRIDSEVAVSVGFVSE